METPLEVHAEYIKDLLHNGATHSEISASLATIGVQRGNSVANIKNFCAKYNMARTGLVSDARLEVEVAKAVRETGPTFGRKMMAGYLASKGIHASEGRVGSALKVVHQPFHEARVRGARNLNPVPYQAEYFGHKMHLDQNEKLVMFGVTHIIAVDGYSKKVVGHATMPIKNNLTIYEEVYRPAVLANGIWDQIRVDKGKEFYLCLFMQEMLSAHRYNTDRAPYLQTPSTANHVVERLWPEINNRVNYPLKEALVQLTDQEKMNMEDRIVQYCVSNLTCHLSRIGLNRVVDSWNAHRIPGKGVPNSLAQGGCIKKIPENLLPDARLAANLYFQEMGSPLTTQSTFGIDPFSTEEDRACAEQGFAEQYPDLSVLYSSVVNNNYSPFQDAVLHLINISQRYANP